MTPNDNSDSACERYTQPEIIALVREVFPIDLDPASCEVANKVVGAKRFYTKHDDGLTKRWNGNVFLNPPYDKRTKLFLEKLIVEMDKGRVEQAIVVFQTKMLNSVSTKWFKPLLSGSICYPNERPRFWSENGEHGSPAGGTVILYVGPNKERFAQAFKDYGQVQIATQPHADNEFENCPGVRHRQMAEAELMKSAFYKRLRRSA